jgi:bifunctional enzyme CysN/CysC
MKIVVVGHVDHGKSTLVGRILHETGALPEGKVEYLREVCDKRGMPFEWAFVMDALQAERDQGITIDTAQIRFATPYRPYVIIDAPGHKEFLKNMITGAASAEAAVLVIDADEGVREQSRRHGYLLHLLGLRQIAVAVNKMDLVKYGQARFEEVKAEIIAYLNSIGVEPTYVIPVAAREGAFVGERGDQMPWYDGPTVLEALDRFEQAKPATDMALRFPVQDVYKFDQRRIIAGRIESGRLRVGDTLVFAPTGKSARIASIEGWGVNADAVLSAGAGQSIGITLDEQIFIERGQVASHADTQPAQSHTLKARLFWLGHNALKVGSRYKLKLATAEHQVEVIAIERVIDVEDLVNRQGSEVGRNAVAEVVFRAKTPIAHDSFLDNPKLGRFVVVEGYDIVGGGVIAEAGGLHQGHKSANITEVAHKVDYDTRAIANGHRGGVIWLTGLSGSGKSTISMEVERQLFLKGWQVVVLDGDNVRHGLCSDLGFSPEDRAENIRRVGEVAHLFAQTGTLVVTAFISPYRADRDRVRTIGPDLFHEVYLSTDLAECERRDPKGLYKKARAGEISEFTGITAPYEAPDSAELVIDTKAQSVDASVAQLLRHIEANFSLSAREQTESWGF